MAAVIQVFTGLCHSCVHEGLCYSRVHRGLVYLCIHESLGYTCVHRIWVIHVFTGSLDLLGFHVYSYVGGGSWGFMCSRGSW